MAVSPVKMILSGVANVALIQGCTALGARLRTFFIVQKYTGLYIYLHIVIKDIYV